MFEWKLSLDTLIGFAALAFGLWKAHQSNTVRLAALETKVEALWEKFIGDHTRPGRRLFDG